MEYMLFTDGGARGNPGPAASAFFIFNDQNELIDFGGEYVGESTNNTAEYNGLVIGLKASSKLGIKKITCYLDSELVVKQIKGEYKVKHEEMKKLHSKVSLLMKEFTSIGFKHVPRAENKFADRLVNTILDARN